MDYTIKGQKVKIVGNDFVTSGGEAKIYRRNKTIYKIYHNPSEMIPDGKIYELQEIKQPKVLIPKEIINDSKGVRVGFTMDYIDNVTPLCKLFTNTFINQNNISNDTIIALISRMQETIKQIHAAKCIQVDGNELNYLVSEKNFMDCYFIDVNSYQTKSFPATVIMPSIRDWTAKKFNELTDWYSFAIIACQLFIGIHPFKGKHQNFKRHDMEKRMRSNVSVFNKNTTFAKSVRDFSRIPANYMDWFINLFEKGKRELPPSRAGEVNVTVQYIIVTSTDNFTIEEHSKYDDVVLDHHNINGISVTRTKKSIYIGNSMVHRVGENVEVVHTPLRQIPTLVKINNGEIELKSLSPSIKVYPGSQMSAEKMMIVDNTIYIKNKGDLIETRFSESSHITNILLVSKKVWSISENSSQLFKNIIVEDILGVKHVTVPLPDKVHSRLIRTRIVELDSYKVLDGKYDSDIAVFSVFRPRAMDYGLLVITGVSRKKYDCRFINTIDMNEVNFVTLDNGIVILIYDDQMEIFSNNTDSSKVKIIKDKELSSSMKLCKRGVSTRFFTDNKLYTIGMK